MIESVFNSLFDLLVPLSIILVVLLVAHKFLLESVSAKTAYFSWLILPLGLITYSLPSKWSTSFNIINTDITKFIVGPAELFQQSFDIPSVNILSVNIIWITISSTFLLFGVLSQIQFHRKLNLSVLDKSSFNIVLPKSLSVYQSSHTYSPMLFGLFKQKLIIPEDFHLLFNEEQQSLILEHEICHFDRNDIYWNLVAFVFIALFWFHPLVWLAYFRFRRDQELSCDQSVLARKQLNSRINYGKALLVAAQTTPPLAFAQLSFKEYGDKNIMFERIKQIKNNTQATKLSLTLVALLSITLLSGLSYAGNSNSETSKKNAKMKNEELYPIVRIEPKYPLKAAQEKIEGSVVLKFDVNRNGKVNNVSVIKAIPEHVFNEVAMNALTKWEYDAAGKKHKDLLVQLDFRIDQNSNFEDVNLIEKIRINQ